jgi:Carboxypeptidase regulatory-like domain
MLQSHSITLALAHNTRSTMEVALSCRVEQTYERLGSITQMQDNPREAFCTSSIYSRIKIKGATMHRPIKQFSLFFIFIFAIIQHATAQVPTASIRGLVSDPAQAIVPGATVIVKSQETGTERSVTTNSAGEYQVANLPPGEYEIKVSRTGFKSHIKTLILRVGDNLTSDFGLELGQANETVMITGETPTINTTDFKIDVVVSRQQIENLPLNGRNFLQLAMIAPGVNVDATAAPTVSPNNFFWVSIAGGNFETMTGISVDGATIKDRITGGTAQNFSQEMVQEFQISTFNHDLSTGVSSVGSINIVSRKGANKFHGTTFIYYRDHNIAAFPGFGRDPRRFDDPSLKDPFFARRELGGSLGGPIKKDNIFWFFSFEKNNQDGVFPVTNNHPIYSQFDHVAPNPLNAKQTNARFDFKVTNRHNAFIRLSTDHNDLYYPLDGVRMPSNWVVTRNVATQALGGLNSIFSSSLQNDLRYSFGFYSGGNNSPTANDCRDPVYCLGLGGPQIAGQGNFRIGTHERASEHRILRTYQLTDTLSLRKGSYQFRFGGEWEHFYWGGGSAFGEPAAIMLHNPITLYTNACPKGGATACTNLPALALYNSLPESLKVISNDGNRTFVPLRPGLLPTVSDIMQLPLRSFTMGIGDPGLPQPYNRDKAARNDRLHFFIADAWRVKPTFTLSYGVAYVYETNLLNHDLDRPPLLSAILGNDLRPPQRDKNNFGPSAGFAWDVTKDGKTVIRGGAGIYYDSNNFATVLRERFLTGPSGNGRGAIPGSSVNLSGVGLLDFATPTQFRGANLMPLLPQIRADLAAQLGDGMNLAVRGVETFKTGAGIFDPNVVVGYAGNVTMGIQREVARNLVVTADFVMRRSIHFGGLHGFFIYDRNRFDRRRAISVDPKTGEVKNERDPIIPQCTTTQENNPKAICSKGVLNVHESSANYRYTGLHVKIDKRFSERYQFTASYALSKFTGFNGVINFDNLFESEGYNETDRTHRFTFSGILELPKYGGGSTLMKGLLNTWQVSLISQMNSKLPLPANILVDLNGDGTSNTPLPGTFFRSFGRSVDADKLRELVDVYNADIERRTVNGVRPRTVKNEILNPILLPEKFDSGDSYIAQDLRLTRFIRISEKYQLSLIGEVFNLFNIANLGGYDGGLQSGRFGQPSNRVGQVFGSGGPRAFQFAARFKF